MSDLLNATLGVVGQVGESLDKVTGGRAVRGALAGKPRELASFIPFSDDLGLTNAADKTSGRDLTDAYGLTDKHSNSWGSSAAGFVADNVLSPMNLLGGAAAFKAAPTLAKGLAGGAKALTGLDAVESLGRGVGSLAKGAKNWATGAKKGGDLLSRFALDDAGSVGFGRDLPNPIDTASRQMNMEGKNGSKAVRFSEDPARAQHYGADRSARFSARLGGGARPNYSKPIGDFLADDSGAFKIPRRPDSEEGLLDWFKGIRNDYQQALADTGTPAGRLKALADTADQKVFAGTTPAENWGARFADKMTGQSLAWYNPNTRVITPNMGGQPGVWMDNALMKAQTKSAHEQGWFSSGAKDSTAIHEIGHGLHHKATVPEDSHFFERLDKQNKFSNPLKDDIRESVSKYASTNPSEFVAEAFTKNAVTQAMTGGLGNGGKMAASPNDLFGMYGDLGGPHPPAALLAKIKQFMLKDDGYLRHAIPGVDPDLANAMDGLGPQYPGGVQKFRDVIDAEAARRFGGSAGGADLADNPFGAAQFADNGPHSELLRRLNAMVRSEDGERLASEIPQGSTFLGAGAEGIALRSPEGSVIRIGDGYGQGSRAEVPEMLQAIREAQIGKYNVQHMPRVNPLHQAFDDPIKRAGQSAMTSGSGTPAEAMQQVASDNWRTNDLAGEMASQMRSGLSRAGYNPWDVTSWNTGLTDEGKAIIFDGGAIKPGEGMSKGLEWVPGQRIKDKPTFMQPQGDLLQQVLAAGGPEKVRQSIAAGLAEGTRGQGVDMPQLEEILANRHSIQGFLQSQGVDPGTVIGSPTPRPITPASGTPESATQGLPPSLLKVLATMGLSAGAAGAGAYALSGQGR